jgi:hypothetical protein
MKLRLSLLALMLFFTLSCKDDDAQRTAEKLKDVKKREAVFATLEKSWHFNTGSLSAQAQAAAKDWAEWRLFLAELRQKPKSSTDAFRKKAKAITTKVTALQNNLPAVFNKPEVKARLTALKVTVQSLDLYVNLDDVPADKVVNCIREINLTINSTERQLEEIIAAGNVRMEQGESDMIRMLDTARAIPGPKTDNGRGIK